MIFYMRIKYLSTKNKQSNVNNETVEYTLKSMRSAVFLKKYADVLTTGVVIASVTMARPNLSPEQISKSIIIRRIEKSFVSYPKAAQIQKLTKWTKPLISKKSKLKKLRNFILHSHFRPHTIKITLFRTH